MDDEGVLVGVLFAGTATSVFVVVTAVFDDFGISLPSTVVDVVIVFVDAVALGSKDMDSEGRTMAGVIEEVVLS